MDDNEDNIKQLFPRCQKLYKMSLLLEKINEDNEDNIKQLFPRCQKLYKLSPLL